MLLCRAPWVPIGRDFNPDEVLSVSAQVDKLILQATSLENLCQCFSGWYVRALLVASESVDHRATGVHSGDSRGYLDFCRMLSMYYYIPVWTAAV